MKHRAEDSEIYVEPHYVGIPEEGLPRLSRHPLYVVLDNIRSAFNVGSMFRTADAGAVAHIYLCGMCAHPPHRKLEKTALGAFDYVPWSYHERTKDVLIELREREISRVAMEVSEGAAQLGSFEWPRPVALVFGNEVTGISDNNLGRCDEVVSIPMWGYKNSMNVATAFGVTIYDVLGSWGICGSR